MFGLSTIQAVIGGVILAAFLGLAGTVWLQHRENGALHEANATLTADLAQATAVNAQNVVELARIEKHAADALAAVTANHAAELTQAKRSAAIKQDIARAPKTDDAVAAPVLGAVLDRLRKPAGPDTNPGSPAVDPSRAAVMPTGAPARP